MATVEGQGSSNFRRWHRLGGVVVLGAFVLAHLLVQGSAMGGAGPYDAVAAALSRSPFVTFITIAIVVVPLVLHAAYGMLLLRRPDRSDAEIERYGGLRAWTAQRLSAVFVAVFVAVHLGEYPLSRLFAGLSSDALFTRLTAHLSWTVAGIPWIALFYVAGIFAVAVHLANGVFAATGAWGMGTSAIGRTRARRLTVGLGAVIFLLGAAIVVCLATGTRLFPHGEGETAPSGPPCGSDVPPKAPASASPSR